MGINTVDYNCLLAGKPPQDDELLRRLTVGADFIADFWRDQYLNTYIRAGGSKIKFLTGRPGSGKSHLLQLFLSEARDQNFKTVSISAKHTWIHDFKEIYTSALNAIDFPSCLRLCANQIITEMGYVPEEIPDGMCFADYLIGKGTYDPITRRELRALLNNTFFRNPRIDKNFAICSALITGNLLGYPLLEPASLDLLTAWLNGEKGVRVAALRKLGLSPSKITKYNARHMLRSLIEILRLAGYAGLIIGIDDLEIMTETSSLEEIRYTKMRREDAYESIRELIDEIDTLSHSMFVFSFDRELLEDEAKGLKSYQALWMRIQNEIEGNRINRFADIIDMDAVARQHYSAEILAEMSRKLAEALSGSEVPYGSASIDEVTALLGDIATENRSCALPHTINRMTLGGTAQ